MKEQFSESKEIRVESIDLVDVRRRYDLIHTRYQDSEYRGEVCKRVSAQLTHGQDIKSFDRQTRQLCGKLVGALIDTYGIAQLDLLTHYIDANTLLDDMGAALQDTGI